MAELLRRTRNRLDPARVLDNVIVWNEQHLRRLLAAYQAYYNDTHLGIAKDSPDHRPVLRRGTIIAEPILGGLHHRYARI